MEQLHYGPEPPHYGELVLPPGSESGPLVTLIHGGFWRHQYTCDLMHPMVTALEQLGYASWNIEYRRVGETGGGFPHTLEDVAAALDYVDHLSDQPWSSHVVIGHSAGGHLALWNAGRANPATPPDVTIGLAPVADVIAANRNLVGRDATTNFFGGDAGDVPENYAAGQPDIASFTGRIVLIHGDADDNVPIDQSLALGDRADRIEILEGVDHFDVIDPNHYAWQIIVDELERLSRPNP